MSRNFNFSQPNRAPGRGFDLNIPTAGQQSQTEISNEEQIKVHGIESFLKEQGHQTFDGDIFEQTKQHHEQVLQLKTDHNAALQQSAHQIEDLQRVLNRTEKENTELTKQLTDVLDESSKLQVELSDMEAFKALSEQKQQHIEELKETQKQKLAEHLGQVLMCQQESQEQVQKCQGIDEELQRTQSIVCEKDKQISGLKQHLADQQDQHKEILRAQEIVFQETEEKLKETHQKELESTTVEFQSEREKLAQEADSLKYEIYSLNYEVDLQKHEIQALNEKISLSTSQEDQFEKIENAKEQLKHRENLLQGEKEIFERQKAHTKKQHESATEQLKLASERDQREFDQKVESQDDLHKLTNLNFKKQQSALDSQNDELKIRKEQFLKEKEQFEQQKAKVSKRKDQSIHLLRHDHEMLKADSEAKDRQIEEKDSQLVNRGRILGLLVVFMSIVILYQ